MKMPWSWEAFYFFKETFNKINQRIMEPIKTKQNETVCQVVRGRKYDKTRFQCVCVCVYSYLLLLVSSSDKIHQRGFTSSAFKFIHGPSIYYEKGREGLDSKTCFQGFLRVTIHLCNTNTLLGRWVKRSSHIIVGIGKGLTVPAPYFNSHWRRKRRNTVRCSVLLCSVVWMNGSIKRSFLPTTTTNTTTTIPNDSHQGV